MLTEILQVSTLPPLSITSMLMLVDIGEAAVLLVGDATAVVMLDMKRRRVRDVIPGGDDSIGLHTEADSMNFVLR